MSHHSGSPVLISHTEFMIQRLLRRLRALPAEFVVALCAELLGRLPTPQAVRALSF
jgi:hypothetical protein